jgi:hypothetical protein
MCMLTCMLMCKLMCMFMRPALRLTHRPILGLSVDMHMQTDKVYIRRVVCAKDLLR